MSNVVNQVPFLRTSRLFPKDLDQLTIELTKSYIDIANTVNERIIAIFPTSNPAITGENWFFGKNEKHQGFRKVFILTDITPIDHGIELTNVNRFTRCYGEYTDGTNWYGIINGTSVVISGQLVFYVTPTQIIFVEDGSQPALTAGNIVLEWVSNT
jgi:hypothetical protein